MAISWLVTMLFALFAVSASIERLRRVRRAVSFDLAALARALRQSPGRASLVRMKDLVERQGASWEKEVLCAALDAENDVDRVAKLDELLGDAARALDWGARIPLGSARLSALGSLAVLFFGLAGGRAGLGYILPQLAWGGVGVVGALAAGREADKLAAEIRSGIDAWIERVLDAARADYTSAHS